MRISDLLIEAVQRLNKAGIPDAETESAVLLCHILNTNRTSLFLSKDQIVSKADLNLYEKFIIRRLSREPVSYITGEREFWSLPFMVDKDVLIPRAETEQLIETVLTLLKTEHNNIPQTFEGNVLDLGVGSGVISIVLALELSSAKVYGIDYSYEALTIARQNSKRHGVDSRVHFINADWLSALCPEKQFDLVVSNPPYVASELLEISSHEKDWSLQPEVGLFEPALALDGGEKGIQSIERIAKELGTIMKPGGWFFMEIGADQKDLVMECFKNFSYYENMKVFDDYAGQPRIFQAKRK